MKKAFTLAEVFLPHSIRKTAFGFTLAEVLITLGIIGVVAAMTLPTLIQKHQEKVTITQLKKAYSIFSQAYMSAVNENGTPDNWNLVGSNSPIGSENIYNKLAPYLNVAKVCGTDTGCFYSDKYKYKNKKTLWANVDKKDYLGLYKFVLPDGMSAYIQTRSETCEENANVGLSPATQSICAFIVVDINGNKKPNAWANDLFAFLLTKHGLIPRGASATPSGVNSFSEGCIPEGHYGWACTGWVLANENFDYLKCNDLSWDGKKKCN